MKVKPGNRSGEVLLKVNRRDESLLLAANDTQEESAFRIKDILVPIDFSDCSKKALRYAIPLAKEHEAALTLVYVVPNCYAVGEYGGLAYVPVAEELHMSATKELADLIANEVKGEVPATARVFMGNPAHQITEVARTLPTDLIIISTHGRTGLKHVFVGSVAEHVIRHAPCPVLVVREQQHEFLANSG
jgi:universal stress protein A